MKQFSIRDLMLFVFFVSLALAWWIDRHNQVATPARYQLQTSGGEAFIVDTATGQLWHRGDSQFFQPKIAK